MILILADSLRYDFATKYLKGIFPEESWGSFRAIETFTAPVLASVFTGQPPEVTGMVGTGLINAFTKSLPKDACKDTLFDHFDSWITISRLIGNGPKWLPPSRRDNFKFLPPIKWNAVSNNDDDVLEYVGRKWSMATNEWWDLIFYHSWLTHGPWGIDCYGPKELPCVVNTDRLMQRMSRDELHNWYKLGVDDFLTRLRAFKEITNNMETIIVFADHGECNPEGDILTKDGIKDISEVEVGEYVMDATGKYNKVIKTFKYKHNDKLIEIKPYGFTKYIRFTPNHPILIYNNGNPKFVPAKDIKKGDKLVIPIPNVKKQSLDMKDYIDSPYIEGDKVQTLYKHKLLNKPMKHPRTTLIPRDMTDNAFLTLCGLYISEGNVGNINKGTGTVVYIAGNTRHIAKESADKLGLNSSIISRRPGMKSCVIYSTLLGRLFVKWFGHKSGEKHLPEWVWSLPNNKLKILIDAMWAGDGGTYYDKRRNRTVRYYKTTSPTLAYQLQLALMKLGIISNLTTQTYNNEIRGYKSSGIVWTVRYQTERKRIFNTVDGKYGIIKIRDIRVTDYDGYVYNLEVENSHTYLINNISVHNSLGEDPKGAGHFAGGTAEELRKVPIWVNRAGVDLTDIDHLKIKDLCIELHKQYELENEKYIEYKNKKLEKKEKLEMS